MDIRLNVEKIDKNKLLNMFKEKKIDYINKEIYIFVYNFLDILNLIFLNDITNFLSNKSNNNKSLIIVYQNINIDYDFEHKYESLYKKILKLIKIRFPEIEYILWDND